MYLLLDIGGTKMRIAATDDKKTFTKPLVIPTPKDFEEGMKSIKEAALKLTNGIAIKATAIGIAGPLNQKKDQLANSPNIPGWVGKPIKKELENNLGTVVYLENDASMAGLGEAVVGAGKGHQIVVYITVSTGVGGTRIVEGKIDQSTYGFEPGQQIIDAGGTLCPACGTGYTLENYISGGGIEARFHKKPKEITDPAVWDELARGLAYGLNNSIVHWSPDIVVLGGSMIIGDPKISVERVEFHLKQLLTIYPKLPKIVKAELKDFGGLHGALAFLSNQNI